MIILIGKIVFVVKKPVNNLFAAILSNKTGAEVNFFLVTTRIVLASPKDSK